MRFLYVSGGQLGLPAGTLTRLLARREGRFGSIRVLERKSDGARLYCMEGSLQTLMLAGGDSAFGYVHALKLLLGDARQVLLIGGAGASLASMLVRRGHEVTVVDIDPAAEELARDFFSLHAEVQWVTTDSLTFLDSHPAEFDAIVVDACDINGLVSSAKMASHD